MAFSLDANVLLYASDRTNPWHAQAVEFLRKCAEGREELWLAWPTLMAYLRISTHPGIFAEPLSSREAEENVEALLRLPHVRLLAEEGLWSSYRRVTAKVPARGNLVPDAQLAALLLHNGLDVLYTKDTDFRQFDFLTVKDPY